MAAKKDNKRKAPPSKASAKKQQKRAASPAKESPAVTKKTRGAIESDVVSNRKATGNIAKDVKAWEVDDDEETPVKRKKAASRSASPAPKKKAATAATKKVASPAKSRSPSPAKTRSRAGSATKAAPKSKARSPSPAPKKRSPSPAPKKKSPSPAKKQSGELSPGWEMVKSKKVKKVEKKADQKPKVKAVEMPVEKSGASKSRSSSRSPASGVGGANAAFENFRNETAIDDEQYIQYYFRTGIIDQWSRTVVMLATTIAPLFVMVSMYCYLRGDKKSAQLGVTFIVIYALVVALCILVGLPAVLVQRVTISTLTGTSPSKSNELEVLCLLLFIITGISLVVTMRVGGYIVWPSF